MLDFLPYLRKHRMNMIKPGRMEHFAAKRDALMLNNLKLPCGTSYANMLVAEFPTFFTTVAVARLNLHR